MVLDVSHVVAHIRESGKNEVKPNAINICEESTVLIFKNLKHGGLYNKANVVYVLLE